MNDIVMGSKTVDEVSRTVSCNLISRVSKQAELSSSLRLQDQKYRYMITSLSCFRFFALPPKGRRALLTSLNASRMISA